MTFGAALLGLPAPNGLIPQAPIHTRSLVVHGPPLKDDEEAILGEKAVDTQPKGRPKEVAVRVVEQRVSNLAQGVLCLVLLTRPFLHLLSFVPRGVLAGLFWHMGIEALADNPITTRILFLLREDSLQSPVDPLLRVRKSRIAGFLLLELLGFGATFAIVQSSYSAIGFPIIISFLIPLRTLVLPMLPYTAEELNILDQPTASAFVSLVIVTAKVY